MILPEMLNRARVAEQNRKARADFFLAKMEKEKDRFEKHVLLIRHQEDITERSARARAYEEGPTGFATRMETLGRNNPQ